MTRTLALLTLLPLLVAAGTPTAPVLPAAGDPLVIEAAFRKSAAISRSARSGDLYTLSHPYNYIIESDYMLDEFSHLKDGRTIRHKGTSHGTSWAYDTRIPLVFYGPGRVKANYRPTADATQEDLPATYAWLLGVQPPRDNAGRPLKDAFLPQAKPPKAILTILIDQGGRTLYASHPESYPNIKRLMGAGTDYVNANVTHLDSETALGHIAVSTGAYPDRTGIPSNYFFFGGYGDKAYSFQGERKPSPLFLESPTLGDHWLRATNNQAILISQCYSDRAAMGMAGHGSYYKGNKKPIVVFYDDKNGVLATNPTYYDMPEYLKAYSAKPYWEAFNDAKGLWMGHDMADTRSFRSMPGMARLDGDAFVQMIEREPIGADDVTDLLYLTMKAQDAAGHRFGLETLEAEAVLKEIDQQIGRIVTALEAKAGKGNVVIALSADHGAVPLPELTGGSRMAEETLVDAINKAFSKDARFPVCLHVSNTQIWLDEQALATHGKTRADVAQFLREMKVNGKLYYRMILDKTEIEAERVRLQTAERAAMTKGAKPAAHH